MYNEVVNIELTVGLLKTAHKYLRPKYFLTKILLVAIRGIMFELAKLQEICNKINSKVRSAEFKEYFNSELEKLYPSLANITLTEELISKSQSISVIDNYINTVLNRYDIKHFDIYSSFYDVNTYEKAMELEGTWYKKVFDKITNNLFKCELDKSVGADSRKLLLIQIEYIYNHILKTSEFIVSYINKFLEHNRDLLRFTCTQYCHAIIKLIDWQIESCLYDNIWADFFTKHLFYNGRKHKWLYLLSYCLQVKNKHFQHLANEIFDLQCFAENVEDDSVRIEYSNYYRTGLNYFKDLLTGLKDVNVNDFIKSDKISPAFMQTVKFSERIHIDYEVSSIIIYSVIGYYLKNLDNNEHYQNDLNKLCSRILDKSLKSQIGSFNFSNLYRTKAIESDALVEINKQEVAQYLDDLSSEEYLKSELNRYGEKYYHTKSYILRAKKLPEIISSFKANNLGSIKVAKGLDYKDSILYTLLHIEDHTYNYIHRYRWTSSSYDEAKSIMNNLILSKYIGDETVKLLPYTILVDNNLLSRQDIAYFNIWEYRGDVLYGMIIDSLIINNRIVYKTNYHELKSAAFQEALIKDWKLEDLIQSNGLVLVNKKPFSTADYFEAIMYWYVEANGFEKSEDFIYNLIQNYDSKLCTNGKNPKWKFI